MEADKEERTFGDVKYREQDRVMQVKIITIYYGKKIMTENSKKN